MNLHIELPINTLSFIESAGHCLMCGQNAPLCPERLGVGVLGERMQLLAMVDVNYFILGAMDQERGRLDLLDEMKVGKHVQ